MTVARDRAREFTTGIGAGRPLGRRGTGVHKIDGCSHVRSDQYYEVGDWPRLDQPGDVVYLRSSTICA